MGRAPGRSLEALMRSVFGNSVRPCLSQARNVITAFLKNQSTHAVARSVAHLIESPDHKDQMERARQCLKLVATNVNNRFRQEAMARIGEAVKDRLTDNITQLIDHSLEKFREGTVDGFLSLRESTPFPIGTRFAWRRGRGTLVVVEQPPMVRTVRFSKGFIPSGKAREFSKDTLVPLAFPYVVFLVYASDENVSKLYCFYRTAPLDHVRCHLKTPNLPNIGTGGAVCTPIRNREKSTLTQRIEEAIGDFWHSTFTNDYSSYYTANPAGDIEKWSEKTKRDPLFVLTLPWQTYSSRLHQLANEIFEAQKTGVSSAVLSRLHEDVAEVAKELADSVADVFKTVPVASATKDRQIVKDISAFLTSVVTPMVHKAIEDMMKKCQSMEEEAGQAYRESLEHTVTALVTPEIVQVILKEVFGQDSKFPRNLHELLDRQND